MGAKGKERAWRQEKNGLLKFRPMRMIDIIHPASPCILCPSSHVSSRPGGSVFALCCLSGFEGEIRETERLTEGKIELDEEEAGRLDERLRQIRQHLSVCPRVSLTWFCRMRERTELLAERETAGRVKKLDPVQGLLVFTDGRKIPLEQIVWIEEETGISDF